MNIVILLILQAMNCCFVATVVTPSVFIPGKGMIFGTYLKMFRTQNIKAYLGIRYAEASRFSPPEIDLPSWTGVLNASTFGPDCWQPNVKSSDKETDLALQLLTGRRDRIAKSNSFEENCLHLNIYLPDGPPGNSGYAVIVWIHSGDFSSGSARDVQPFQLVFKQKVIVVTISYRLSIFGFLATDDGEAQGNYGLMDQSAALYWIKKNINYFGGDENRITLMGHAAGGISVGLHLTSGEWSKDAFHGAIIMSGNPITYDNVKTPKEYNYALDAISNTFGCVRKPTNRLIECLKRVDAKVIIQNLPLVDWGPVVDVGLSNTSYPFIENYPILLFQKGNFHKVPVIVGITDMEDAVKLFGEDLNIEITQKDFDNFLQDIAENDIRKIIGKTDWCSNFEIITDSIQYVYTDSAQFYHNTKQKIVTIHTEKNYIAPLYFFADVLSNYQTGIYIYIFDFRPKTSFYNLPDWINVPKYFDQLFFWGIPYMSSSDIAVEWDPTDKKISDIVMTLLANFARSLNPTKSNVYIKWNALNKTNQTLLFINDKFNLGYLNTNLRIEFWNNYYQKLLQFSIDCCNTTNIGTCFNVFFKLYYLIIFHILIRNMHLINCLNRENKL